MNNELANAEAEHRHHSYRSNVIPSYVRLIWALFWIFAIYYAVTYLLPAMQQELLSPP
jgi:hypothetical protein